MSAPVLLGALALDALLGEPRWLWSRVPHPAVLMGKAVGSLDMRLNHGRARRAKGIVALALLVAGAACLGWVLSQLGWVIELIIAAILLAQRSLCEHVSAVALGLRGSLSAGRAEVAMIVSRDTAHMDRSAVARSAIESAAENLSDGVIAPAVWFLAFGLPGLLIYKITNTADSMIGYRTEKYEAFGWAAARFDDLLNLIPARLTALLIGACHGVTRQWKNIRTDAHKHRSPNAGWPEAALSRALSIALAGPRSYDGRMQTFDYVNPEGRRQLDAPDIDAAVRALWATWACFGAIVFVLTLLGF